MFEQYQQLGTQKVMLGGGESTTLDVAIVWGISGVDDSDTNPWKPSDLGDVTYDPNFDVSTAASQAHLMATYEALKTAPCSVKACSDSLLINPTTPIRNILAETAADGATLTGGFYFWLRQQDAAYASAHPVTAPVTGDAFNVNLCKYSKLDATKVTYASHVGLRGGLRRDARARGELHHRRGDGEHPHAAGAARLRRRAGGVERVQLRLRRRRACDAHRRQEHVHERLLAVVRHESVADG